MDLNKEISLNRFSFRNKNEDYDTYMHHHDLSPIRTSCASTTSSLQLYSPNPEIQWSRLPLAEFLSPSPSLFPSPFLSAPQSPSSSLFPSPSLSAPQSPFPSLSLCRSPSVFLSPSLAQSSSIIFHCLASLHHSHGKIFSIAASKHYIFIGSESARIRAWKLPECIETRRIKSSAGEIRALLADGNILFTAHGDYKIRVWDMPLTESFRPRKITTLPRKSLFKYPKTSNKHTDCVSCMCYNQLEKLLYTGSWDRTVKVWRISDKKHCVDSFLAHNKRINAIVMNQENGCVFTASSDGTVKIWRRIFDQTISTHILTVTLNLEESPVNALALSKRFLYSGSSDGLVNFWEKEITSGRYNHGGFLHGHQFGVLCLAAIEDLILSGSEDTTIRIWKRHEDEQEHEHGGGMSLHTCLAIIDGHHGPVKCLAARFETEDIKIDLSVYSASLDRTIKVWRVKVYQCSINELYEPEPEPEVKIKHEEIDEFQMSPVLSPSWVERRINGSCFD